MRLFCIGYSAVDIDVESGHMFLVRSAAKVAIFAKRLSIDTSSTIADWVGVSIMLLAFPVWNGARRFEKHSACFGMMVVEPC